MDQFCIVVNIFKLRLKWKSWYPIPHRARRTARRMWMDSRMPQWHGCQRAASSTTSCLIASSVSLPFAHRAYCNKLRPCIHLWRPGEVVFRRLFLKIPSYFNGASARQEVSMSWRTGAREWPSPSKSSLTSMWALRYFLQLTAATSNGDSCSPYLHGYLSPAVGDVQLLLRDAVNSSDRHGLKYSRYFKDISHIPMGQRWKCHIQYGTELALWALPKQ